MKTKHIFCILLSCSLIVGGCKKNQGNNLLPELPEIPVNPAEKMEIKISPSLGTKATDTGFETNDRIGLYVVNYNGSSPQNLLENGNHVDNMGFTYTGLWTPDSPIFWKDDVTHADFYIYYPYSPDANVSAHPFKIQANQSTETAYKASDYLIGKAENVAPTSSAIAILANHLMSRVNISLAPGNGFTKESLAAADISVRINGLKTESTINLSSGVITAKGNATAITPLRDQDSYKAIVIPQTVEESDLISVTVDGREFKFKKGFTFESGKSHQFTITLSKTSNGINVNINPWNEDGTDNGGTAE